MEKEVIFIDGIHSIGVHNNVVRISFFRLNPVGHPEVVLELNIPLKQVKEIIQALTKIQ